MDNNTRKKHRTQERIPYTKEIMINDTLMVKSIDISKGGLYVHTSHSLKLGNVVEISLPIRNGQLKIKARVKHKQAGVGMGLMFINMDDVQKSQIEELIEDIKKRPPKPKTEKPTVLFVEDNTMSRKIIKNKLISEGFWVIEAKNGIEAIKTLDEQSVDVLVLDLYMEKMDGFKVLTIIKESPKWKDIPVIVLSAKGTDDVIDTAIRAGADDFLVKMVTSPVKLAEVLRTVIKRQESQKNSRDDKEK